MAKYHHHNATYIVQEFRFLTVEIVHSLRCAQQQLFDPFAVQRDGIASDDVVQPSMSAILHT